MDICAVCCKANNDDGFSRISTASSEWKEWNIQRIIEKHLWWWYLRPNSNKKMEQWICCQCWHELSTFHNFYIKVEKENREYEKLLNNLSKIHNEELPMTIDIKVEDQSYNFSDHTEDHMQLEKNKTGRKRKMIDSNKIIQIEDLPLIEAKSENDVPEDMPELLVIDEVISTNWEHSSLNDNKSVDSEAETFEETNLEDNNDDNVLLDKKSARKRQAECKSFTKCTKKYTKIKNDQTSKETNASETKEKNDELIADYQFVLSCNLCDKVMDNFTALKIHFRKEHNILGYAMCCSKKFHRRGELVDHLSLHKDPNCFKCLQCEKTLATRRSYEKHLETHQLIEAHETRFTCDTCNKSFLKKAVFERHVLTHVPEEERNFHCDLCDKKFASEYLRKQHHTLTHSKKYAKICDMCGKSLRDKISFIKHMAEHNGETPAKVKCDICGAELTNKYRLNRHIKLMHTHENQQEQICPYCSKVSPNLNAHKLHIKYTHTLERKHECHMCDKKFRLPSELKEHLSSHTQETLYACPYCPRRFVSHANMYKHRKREHYAFHMQRCQKKL